MATGWAGDGAVQQQIDDSIEDAIKRARAQLLKAQTDKQLDKLRFNILTSLLRLRQICCHPRLLGLDEKPKSKKAEAAAPAADAKK